MRYKLLADAGSTKVEWTLITSDGQIAATVRTAGINAVLSTPDSLMKTLESVGESLCIYGKAHEIHYYGAGCANTSICEKMSTYLKRIWSEADIYVNSDMLAAARALFGYHPGIACILGTGSNSCLYDGTSIIRQIPSLGYILGDEGSGAVLGRRLISDIFKQQLPQEIIDHFKETYGIELSDIIENVYRMTAPSKYLASFVPFLKENLEWPEVHAIVYEEFLRFIDRNVSAYNTNGEYALKFIGSIAVNFDTVLHEAASARKMEINGIYKSPMEGLIKYHTTPS